MTLKELIDNTKNWIDNTEDRSVNLFDDTTSWFSDGFEKLVQGNILELTIWQALLITFIILFIFMRIKDAINNVIKEWK